MTPYIWKDPKTGKYILQWREPSDNGYVQKKKRGFQTKREALSFFTNRLVELEISKSETETDQEEMSFRDLADEWLQYEKSRIKGSSYATMESRVRSQLIPAFGDMLVKDITPMIVLKWQQSLEGKFEYRKNVRSRLTSIFKYASKYHNINNVMDKVDGLRNLEPKKEMAFWTPDQFKIFCEHCDNEMYRLFFKCLYVLGCRKGELQALTWANVDFANCDIHICHTITNKIAGETWTVTTPKNRSSDRHVRIPRELCDELLEYKRHSNGDINDFCFGKGRPLPSQTIGYSFDRVIDLSGLSRIRIHDLRHSCASLLISQGIDIVTVSKRLGHSSVKQTLDTYSHMMPSSEERTVTIFSNYLNSLK